MIPTNPLISSQWLNERINTPDLIILDCSWYLPAQQRDPNQEYSQGHIAGAQFFDINAISDHSNPLPHMLPSADDFAKAVGAMGISNTSTIVLYDGMGVFSSPRVWWTFLVFGAQNVYILNGGLPAWIKQGFGVTQAATIPKPAQFKAVLNTDLMASMNDMRHAIADKTQIIDARPAARFNGSAPEPRAGLPSGHMQGAHNIPQSTLVQEGHFLEGDALKQRFIEAGVDINAPIITSCGSGITAASITLGLAVLGKPIGRLYDGSWVEWAQHNPITP